MKTRGGGPEGLTPPALCGMEDPPINKLADIISRYNLNVNTLPHSDIHHYQYLVTGCKNENKGGVPEGLTPPVLCGMEDPPINKLADII